MSDNHLTELRLCLLGNGFEPIPVVAHDAPGTSPGKRPRLSGWQNIALGPDVVRGWDSSHLRADSNTGLRTGELVGIDIDCYSPALSERLQKLALAHFDGEPSIRIGMPPKALLCYRTAVPRGKKATPTYKLPAFEHEKDSRVEVLGRGEQFVAFGVHPDTKKPYQWIGPSPLDIPLSELPLVTNDAIDDFLAMASRMFVDAGGVQTSEGGRSHEPRERTTSAVAADPSAYDEIADALRFCPNNESYQDWAKIGAAIYNTLGNSGLSIWTDWSGKYHAYIEADAKEKWDSFSRSPMSGVSKLTIFEFAYSSGWKSAAMLAKEERDRQRVQELQDAERAWGPPVDQFDDWPSEIQPPTQSHADHPSQRARSDEPEPEAPKAKSKGEKKAKPEAEKAKPEATEKELPEWAQWLQTDDKGQFLSNLANALMALRKAPELEGLVAYDQMMRQLMFTRGIANSRMKDTYHRRPVEDAEVSVVQEWMQRNCMKRITKETVQQALEQVGRENAFHPVRDYMNSVKWDGIKRLSRWMITYLGCSEEKKDYLESIGRWFFLSMIARTFNPGCKCDYMVILEGEQGLKKSTACGIIAGEWFSDNLPEIRGGDEVRVAQHLRGKLLIEIGELSSMKGAAAEALKTFITRRDERYIAKYGRNEVHEARQCVFIGTTNQANYLHDETGARRFWPVKVGAEIKLDDLKRDRDQLFAEAVAAYKAKEQYWPSREFERKHIETEQSERYVEDAWEPILANHLEVGGSNAKPTTLAELARRALGIEPGHLHHPAPQRIANILKRLGWTQKREENVRVWAPPDPPKVLN